MLDGKQSKTLAWIDIRPTIVKLDLSRSELYFVNESVDISSIHVGDLVRISIANEVDWLHRSCPTLVLNSLRQINEKGDQSWNMP